MRRDVRSWIGKSVLALSALLVANGCKSDSGNPGDGGPTRADADAGGEVAGHDDGSAGVDGHGSADFQTVLAIFAQRCTICHDAKTNGLPHYPMLSLVAADAYAALVGVPADETCGGTRVVPGNADASYLMQKLTQDPPCFGLHMPRSFEIIPPQPLSADELGSIRSWINAGAPP
jgi:hypothetical protein